MTKIAFIPNFVLFYNILWTAALPFLRKHPRLAGSFFHRTHAAFLEPADIWIQAASAGEAFLAACLVQRLTPGRPVQVLITTTTDQGMEILTAELKKNNHHPQVSISLAWFPFDMPAVAKTAVKAVNPKVMVLLETELWPALLYFLKQNRTRILVVNGRMSKKSSRGYRLTRSLWSRVYPNHILAISGSDADRYRRVFARATVSTMPNIKFESIVTLPPEKTRTLPAQILPCPLPVSVLASIRHQEEKQALQMLHRILDKFPDQVVAIFPRHMHRIVSWKRLLKRTGHRFYLRSQISAPLSYPGIILWDRFGEMRCAFDHADVVFMGGSLAPLGGQNFMEPLLRGAPVVTGPFWDDFFWVGKEVFDTGLVTRKPDWQTIADAMVHHLIHPGNRHIRRQKALAYVSARTGGADMACQAILAALSDT
ncbi:MAG: 3-deoxy-D-manno-octulosonic acid transferase [Desulfotignum sp.]|nr:3-deoxy-D-manno-octulosonic acid transferase [Desulfotignum sp.]MCF8112638.1 3-deoxy-D-manno-octulosonic acid transferase [Desulfotignum sp.]MCF8124802.1 3-deoxy-D-manno-octulosonic acid transferase [Desulfotignum sp.]